MAGKLVNIETAQRTVMAHLGEDVTGLEEIFSQIPRVRAKVIRHSKWISPDGTGLKWHCEKCLHPVLHDSSGRPCFSAYCPHCGGEMIDGPVGFRGSKIQIAN